MFPYNMGGSGFDNGTSMIPFAPFAPFAPAALWGDGFGRDLPDEVKAAIEERKGEIHSAEDLHRIAHEVMQKR